MSWDGSGLRRVMARGIKHMRTSGHPIDLRATEASKTPAALFLFGLCALFISALAFASSANAQTSSAEPGKRITGHAKYDCIDCHSTGSGIDRQKCLGCHEHKPLGRRIRAGKGLHATPRFKADCQTCHAEHKGRRFNPIDWREFGGESRFNHGLTGYKLEGAHNAVKCKECHKAKFKSGRTQYLGLDENCLSCHNDVHRFKNTHKELTDCKICHAFDARTVVKAEGLRFRHGKVADFKLNGRHKKTRCTACHSSTTIFKMKTRPDRCVDCHKDIHKNAYTANKRDCISCHSDSKLRFTKDVKGRFNHGKETRFRLGGKHAKQSCKKCHTKRLKTAPKMACNSCHFDDSSHVVKGEDRFKGRDCNQCHSDTSFKRGIEFNHFKRTKFALRGKHDRDCIECHRKKPKNKIKVATDTFEFFPSDKCIGCHSHENAHQKKFHDRPNLCVKCHPPGKDPTRLSFPDHSELTDKFAQMGAHKPLDCAKCHGDGLVKLKVGEDCSSCHKEDDAHEGNLGDTCKSCHLEGFPWSNVIFDHNVNSEFKLEGKHQAVACTKCHTSAPKVYKPLKQDCASCHADQDVHNQKLGNDCGKCHDATGKAPLFDHNSMTDFILRGSHVTAECRGCHFDTNVVDQTAPKDVKLDLEFGHPGNQCSDCHGDPHGLRAGASCEGCHNETSFLDARGTVGAGDEESGGTKIDVKTPDSGPNEKAIFDGGPESGPGAARKGTETNAAMTAVAVIAKTRDRYHDTPPFSLRGGHRRLDCTACHGGRGDMQGLGKVCDTCHRQDDIHAGSLGPTCADCHSIRTWTQPDFSHGAVGFSLVGSHRMLSCKQCHTAGNYMGLSGDCLSCHLDDAMRAGASSGVPHTAYVGTPCLNCHTQITWNLTPAFRRRF